MAVLVVRLALVLLKILHMHACMYVYDICLWLYVVEVDTVDKFKLRLDNFWMYQDIKYDFTAELTGTGDRFECDSGNYY